MDLILNLLIMQIPTEYGEGYIVLAASNGLATVLVCGFSTMYFDSRTFYIYNFTRKNMAWLLLTVSCILLWGTTDILYKKSSDYNDSLSHFKTFVWIGIIMAPSGGIMAICSDTLPDSIVMVKDNLYLIPLCVFYAIALFFGLLEKNILMHRSYLHLKI